MVNRNHSQFDRKNFFNFWKTKTVKSFSGFELLILAHTFVWIHHHRIRILVSDCQNLVALAGFQQPPPKFDKTGRNLNSTAGIQKFLPDSGLTGQIPTSLTGIWFVGIRRRLPNPILHCWWFFHTSQTLKNIFKKIFFFFFLWKRISLKILYEGKHSMPRQTKD